MKGTANFGITYKHGNMCNLVGYCDSDWAGSLEDMKSTSGYLFMFDLGPFSWSSHKQGTTAQSTAEAEYISAAAASNQAIWLRKLLDDLGCKQTNATIIYCDNTSAIAITKNPVQHRRTKHIPVKYHSIREAERNKEISLMHCSTNDQLADILTKPLPKERLQMLRNHLHIMPINAKEEC